MTIHITGIPSPTATSRNLYTVQALYDASRSFKLGSVVPIGLRLLNAQGDNVSSAAIVPTATGLVRKDTAPAPDIQDAGHANPDGGFHHDPTLQGYVFNLSTKTLAIGTWELGFMVPGDTWTYHISFSLSDTRRM